SIAGPEPEKAAVPPISVGSRGHFSCFRCGELEDERIQIRRPGQRSKCSKTRLQLVLNAKVNAARVLTSTIDKRDHHLRSECSGRVEYNRFSRLESAG